MFADERPAAFKMLLCFYGLAALFAVFIAVDLLFGVDVGSWP